MKTIRKIENTYIYFDPNEFVKLFDSYNRLTKEQQSQVHIEDNEYAFVIKNPNNMYILINSETYKSDPDSRIKLRSTIAHEIGHLQKKIQLFFDEESKADYFMRIDDHISLVTLQATELIRIHLENKN